MQFVRQGHRQNAGSGVRLVSAVVQQQQYGARHHGLPTKREKTGINPFDFVFHRNSDNNRILDELQPLLAQRPWPHGDIAWLGRTMGPIDRSLRQRPPGSGWSDGCDENYSKSQPKRPSWPCVPSSCQCSPILERPGAWSRNADTSVWRNRKLISGRRAGRSPLP